MLNKVRGKRWMMAAMIFGAAVVPGVVWAGGGGGGGGGGLAGMDPQQLQTMLRQRVLAQYQAQVGFTDEEWSVVEPKMWRVAQLQIDTGTGALGSQVAQLGGGGGGGGGRGGGGRGGGGLSQLIGQAMTANGQPSDLAQKRTAMQAALAAADTTPQTMALKLEDYRLAMKKAKAELLKAEEDLKSVVTIRQEAVLVQIGFLE